MSYHGPGARDVLDVLEIVRGEYAVDEERIALTGLSMGGNGTWELALRNPGIFSAIAPVCPPADMNLSEFYTNVLSPLAEKFPFVKQVYNCNQIVNWAQNAKAFPVHIYHGNDDPVVPVEHSHRMVKALAEKGIEAPLTTFDNVGHNAWDPAYKNGETLRRLMGARRDIPAPLIEFATCRYENARYQWLEITRFAAYGQYATLTAGWDPEKKEIRLLKADNIAGLAVYPEMLGLEEGERLNVRLTGGNNTSLTVGSRGPLTLSVGKGKIARTGQDRKSVV